MRTLARARDRAELLERLARLRPDSPRQWGRMSAPEMVCHLTDAFRMAMGDKEVSSASSVPQRTVVKWAALYLPVQWPTGVLVTRPEIEQGSGGTCPGDFGRDVADLVSAMDPRLVDASEAGIRGPRRVDATFHFIKRGT